MRHGMGVLRQLSVESAALFEEIITAENLTCYYEHAGNLSLYKTEHAFEEAAAEARLTQEYGVTIEILDGDEVRAKEPAAASDIVGGVYLPEDAYLDPALFIQGLADSVEKYNGTICTRTEVLGFEVSGKGIQRVKTTRGDFQPEQVVLAVGSWSPKLGQALRLNLPVQPAKGYSITVKRPESGPRTALMLGEARMAVTLMGPNLRFAGTLEMAGLNFDINQRRVEVLRRSANSYLNGNPADNELVEVWRGLRPCTPDGLPIIGLSDSINNLIVATGHATLGVSQGPISGKLVSQIVSGENASVPLESLRPGRFG